MLRTAVRRAQHQLIDAPLILDDPVVLDLVPEARDAEFTAKLNYPGLDPRRSRSLFAMRSRFAEDRLADAAARGVRQYVIVGSGLDTFPWRQPAYARDLQIFAVDHPASLGASQQRFRARGFVRPANLTFVPADLEAEEIGRQLAACGFDPAVPAFCSVLGVVQYLSRAAVDRLLAFAAALPRESEIVLSFVVPDDALDGDELRVAVASVIVAAGEPWKTRLMPAELSRDLAARGFRHVFVLTPELADQRYFAGRDDGLRAPRWEQLIAATV